MRFSRLARLFFLIPGSLGIKEALSQQPFDLDPEFRTQISQQYVASALPVEDGKIIISGMIRFSGDLFTRVGVRLNSDGSHDQSFPNAYMGGKLTRWDNRIYAANGNGVRRSFLNGSLDTDFVINPPYVSIFQGGDYNVFDDGRVVLGGRHMLSDTIRGFVGPHCLTWFSNQGYLDTTRTHRTCSGTLDRFAQLPNGQFIGSGGTEIWDGQPASRIFRFNADGSLDPSFQANAVWGTAYSFLPLEDGRVYVGGQFRIAGLPDTLNLVRLMPDGALDPTFDNTVRYRLADLLNPEIPPWGLVRTVYPLNGEQLIVTGNFSHINGVPRGGIALIDDSGNLLSEYFAGEGCGGYFYQPNTSQPPVSYARVVSGIAPAPDGHYYIWGAYHGYDDGSTNDTLQRMVSRLHGFNVGVPEHVAQHVQLRLHPNPASAWAEIEYDLLEEPANAALVLYDVTGRAIERVVLSDRKKKMLLDTRAITPGGYVVALINSGVLLRRESLIVQP